MQAPSRGAVGTGTENRRSGPWSRAADPLLTGLYAWGTTVALPLSHRATPSPAKWASLGALAALITGAVLLPYSARWGRVFGMGVFVAGCAASWALGRTILVGAHLDAWLGALGSLGWALFALTWAGRPRGALRQSDSTDEQQEPPTHFDADAAQPPTGPRQRLPRWTLAVGMVGGIGAAIPMVLAWWISDRARALVGHGAALVGAVGILSVSAKFAAEWSATPVWRPGPRSPRRVLWRARRPLALAAAVGLVGVILLCLRLR